MASDLRGYSADEVLNKVLNTSNDSIQVDIVAGAEYAEDAAHTSADTGNFVLGVRNDTLAALGGTDGDYVPFQMNASGALYVEVSSSGTGSGVHVDDAAFTLGSHSGVMMMGFAGTQSVNANDAGAIAMETDGSVHIHDGGNTITVDGTVTANLSATDNAVLDAMVVDLDAIETLLTAANVDHAANEALLITIDADTNAIKGHVDGIETLITSTNSKIDTFDAVLDNILTKNTEIDAVLDTIKVDTEEIEGAVETIETAIKAEDAAHSDGDTGIMALVVRNDVLEALAGSDGDYSALQVNKTGALNVTETVGHLGAHYESSTTTNSSLKIVAFQFLEDTKFSVLTPATSAYIGNTGGGGDDVANTEVFPQGMTIFGRWTAFTLVSGGRVIAYLGDW